MKKVYLLLTAICLTALTGCIKEDVELTEANVTMSISTRLDLSSVSSQEQGDAIADINVWAFACDDKGVVSNVEDPAVAWRRITTANTHTSVDVHLQFTTCKDNQPRHYKLVAVINKDAFGTISGITTFDRYTTYKQLADATFEAPEGLMTMNPEHGKGSKPGQMPISHWKIITLDADNDSDDDENIDTHPGECYKVTMPVYRALAKTQLLVAKSDANSTVTIKNVTIGSTAYPTKGALLSAAKGTVKTDGTVGDLNPSNTPQWYVSSVDKSSTKVEKDILTAESVTVDKPLTEEEHAAATADDDYTKFTPITSYFLYENAGGNGGAWNTASTNGGYYMDVTYNAGAGDKTERVWLPAVVRNHDIQVRALVNAGGKLELTFNVQPWTDVKQSWNYTDVASLAAGGELEWADGTNKGQLETVYKKDENGEDTEVVDYRFRNITVSNTTPATCTFHIDTPTGATWQAMFASGDISAFEFVDENLQSLGNTTYGNVGTQAATLRIRATKPAEEINRTQSAFLDIVVKTADGRIIKVNNLMKDGDSGEIRYKMVQVK
ncbi:MAG: hypothetical protein IJ984_07175 [Prevotella sp.]|nr:hypothetical protein [Prevotella sp.]